MRDSTWLTSGLLSILGTLLLIGLGACDLFLPDPFDDPPRLLVQQRQYAYERLKLRWTSIEGASSYYVEMASWREAGVDSVALFVDEAQIDTAPAAGSYSMRVRALKARDAGPWSEWRHFTCDPTALQRPCVTRGPRRHGA